MSMVVGRATDGLTGRKSVVELILEMFCIRRVEKGEQEKEEIDKN